MTKEVELRTRDHSVVFKGFVPEGQCLAVNFLMSPPTGKLRWYARPMDTIKWQPISSWLPGELFMAVEV